MMLSLSPRENQICSLVAQGRRNKQIAAELGVAEGTVKEYLKLIFLKLGCHGRTELAVRYIQDASAATPARAKPSTDPRREAGKVRK